MSKPEHRQDNVVQFRAPSPLADAVRDAMEIPARIMLARQQPWIDATGDALADRYLCATFNAIVVHGIGDTALLMLGALILDHPEETTDSSSRLIGRVLRKWQSEIASA